MYKFKNILFLLFAISYTSCIARQQDSITIYIVRHAEKDLSDPANKDPKLSDEGLKRAVILGEILTNNKLSAVYSTDRIRTRETVRAIAEKNNLPLKLYENTDLKAFANSVLTENKGKTILIAGHSNTILEIAEAFGVKRPLEKIEDHQYDNLIIVKIGSDGNAAVSLKKYGNSSVE